MKSLYSLVIHGLICAIKTASLFNQKAKQAIDGRKNWKQKIAQALKDNKHKIVWFHISSLGEFEQARPLIVSIKKKYSQYKILITFFSPSGYNAQKNFEYADWVFYMPYDTSKNARDFLDIVQPQFIFFVKYEFWINFLFEIKKRKTKYNIKCFLISSIFRKHQPFFKWYGRIFIEALSVYDKIFVQDSLSVRLLKKIAFDKTVFLSGDTRIDRVLEIVQQSVNLPEIERFCSNKKIIIAGSTWYADEKILIPVLAKLKRSYSNISCIIAPHQPDGKTVYRITQLLKKYGLSYCKYTEIKNGFDESVSQKDILIIDIVGILNKIYRYAYIAYIGGGFSDGIHNILEPAVYGLPVLFGRKYEKFYEAVELIRTRGAYTVNNEEELYNQISVLLDNPDDYHASKNSVKQFIENNKGAVDKTLRVLEEYL